MKTVAINSKSWHYRWMRQLDIDPSSNNICAYTRALLKTVLASMFMLALAVLTVMSFGDFFAWCVAIMLTDSWFMVAPLGIWASVLVSFVLVGFAMFGWNKAVDKIPEAPADVKAMWDSIHNNICARTEIKRSE